MKTALDELCETLAKKIPMDLFATMSTDDADMIETRNAKLSISNRTTIRHSQKSEGRAENVYQIGNLAYATRYKTLPDLLKHETNTRVLAASYYL